MTRSRAKACYVAASDAQARLWRAGSGPPLLVIADPYESAAAAADAVATASPGTEVIAVELPGIGGSADVPFTTLDDLADAIGAVAETLGSVRNVLVRGLATALADRLGPPLTVLRQGHAEAMARARGPHRDPPARIAPDGTHLTALFQVVRDAHLLEPADDRRPRRTGEPIPEPGVLDAAVVAAAARPDRFHALWTLLRGALRADDGGMRAGVRDLDTGTALADALRGVVATDARAGSGAPAPTGAAALWCDYVDTPSGRVHLRRAGRDGRPLLVLQSAPGSTAPLSALITRFGRSRRVVAPDYPGNGDSEKPVRPVGDIADVAAMMFDVADALALDSFDVWGTHTGAAVGLEMAIRAPQRIGRLVLEAPPLLDAALTEDVLARYLPPLVPDRWGLHLQQAWNMRRDMFLFWPWYRQAREAVRDLGLPDAAFLHDWTIGLLKSGMTYDRTYRAAFAYPTKARLPLLTRPALVCAGPRDMLADGLAIARALAPGVVDVAATPATVWYPNHTADEIDRTFAVYEAYLGDGCNAGP